MALLEKRRTPRGRESATAPLTWEESLEVNEDNFNVEAVRNNVSGILRRTESSSSSSSSPQAPGGVPQHANTKVQSSSEQFQRSTAESDGAEVPVIPVPTVLQTVTRTAQLRSTSPTNRAAEPTTQDVPPQAKHPRGEHSQMDVQS